MIYHILSEEDTFSAYFGSPLARFVANIMRSSESSIVVTPNADDTWGYSKVRIITIPALSIYKRIKGKRYIPRWLSGVFLRYLFQPLLSRLKRGDIVWCHNQPRFALALQPAIHVKGAKFVYHSHTSVASYRAAQIMFRLISPDCSVFVSDVMRQEAITLFPQIKMAYTLHNWADERRFFSASEESRRDRTIPVILYAGRLNPEKGVHILLEAMRILMERNVDVICKVVGSSRFGGSKPDAYVRSLIRSNPGNVHFTAYLSANDVAEEYRVADILCCPSVYQEAFGFVNIEAMACGIPVVATRVGGIPEIASEGGFILVEPNSPVELADALQKLICDSALRSKLAEEGLRSFRRQFTWDAVRSQYLEIIERLM